MKKIPKIIAIIAMLLAASSNVSAQQSAISTALGNSKVIAPIAIRKTADIDFGNLAVSDQEGTVVLSPAGVRTQTGGVALVGAGSETAASFTVTGQDTFTYDITLPGSLTLIGDNAVDDGLNGNNVDASEMIVSDFTSTPSTNGVLTEGNQIVTVGATLIVNANQANTVYASEIGCDVTVNYN